MIWLTKLISIISFTLFGTTNLNPSSPKNSQLEVYRSFLTQSSLPVSHLQYFDYRQEIEFDINNTHVILDATAKPLIQVSALQKIIKLANIKGVEVSLVDLSSTHPYATLQNN